MFILKIIPPAWCGKKKKETMDKTLLAFLLLGCISLDGGATTYSYVSMWGNDYTGNGNISKPFLTLQRAMQQTNGELEIAECGWSN